MMTEQEFTTALAQLNQLETEKTKAHQAVLASIAAARKQNEQTKALQQALAAIEPNIEQLKAATNAYVAEQNAVKKKAAESAKEAEQSEVQRQAKEIEELKAQLAAKG